MAALIQRVIGATATARAIYPQAVLRPCQQIPAEVAARALAMAVCCAAGAPFRVVAEAFRQEWQTVETERHRLTELCLNDGARRDEFIQILTQSLAPEKMIHP